LVAGVLHDACDGDATNVKMDILVAGSIWEVTVASQTLNRGGKVAMAGADVVETATTSENIVGEIVNDAVATGDTKAQVLILGGAQLAL